MLFSISNTIFFVSRTKFFDTKKGTKMAETIQARLPAEMTPIVKEIKVYREKNLEPTSTKSIIIDALKMMHLADALGTSYTMFYKD